MENIVRSRPGSKLKILLLDTQVGYALQGRKDNVTYPYMQLVKVFRDPKSWLRGATRSPTVKESEQVLESSNHSLLGVQAQGAQHIKQESIPEVTEVFSKKEWGDMVKQDQKPDKF